MKFIKDYKEGDRVFDIYLCKHKQSAVTKNGKPYETVILQDKTGTVDGTVRASMISTAWIILRSMAM